VRLSKALEAAVAKSGAPGAVALVGRGEKVLFHDAVGKRQLRPALAAEKDTIYDLASLTKVVCTATLVMMLRDEGKLRLEQPISDFLRLEQAPGVTLRQLLQHTSGLPAGIGGLYFDIRSTKDALARIAVVKPKAPPGEKRIYSDLGYILLGHVIEQVGGERLDIAAARRIFQPLGMTDTCFTPAEALRTRCAATEQCAWRKRLLVGEVHDQNASAMGGVAGHAGLFGTAADLAVFAQALLAGRVLPEATLAEMCAPGQVPYYPWQGLGWKYDPWAGSVEGFLPARRAIGHTGWTGTNLWIDLDSKHYVILLSNTCHPTVDARDNRTLRTVFHTAAAEAAMPGRANTHAGVDRVFFNNLEDFAGKRIGLLTHLAAVDLLGRDTLTALRAVGGLNIQRVFTPEHGLRGQAEAGEQVRGQRAEIPVVSLYGEKKAPAPEDLRDLDVFVINLQDIGARYYTYVATMLACLRACAAAKVPVSVLDRPNPLGGIVLEGPLPTTTESLVCSVSTPIRHGMTIAEMAQFLDKTALAKSGLRLGMLELDNWPRELYFDALAYPWLPPSPNIPDVDTALAYVGTCLFEGVNVNEGRGTDAPFLRCGAPWLDASAVLDAVPRAALRGCALSSERYTPRAIPGKATAPIYRDEPCEGIRIAIENREEFRPFTLAYALLAAMHRRHRDKLEWKPFFDTLAGGPALRQAILGGMDASAYVESLTPALARFDATRPKLYRTSSERLESALRVRGK